MNIISIIRKTSWGVWDVFISEDGLRRTCFMSTNEILECLLGRSL